MRRIFSLAICFMVSQSVQAQDPNTQRRSETEAAYHAWVRESKETGKAETADPLFQKLLTLPDADLFLLEGLLHRSQTIRRTSEKGLAQLKTDRAFASLVASLTDQNQFRREKALQAIAGFKQPRCVAFVLRVLESDSEPQVREVAARCLSSLADSLEDERIEPALRKALKTDIDRVATEAAEHLGRLNSNAEEVVRLTYTLAQRVEHKGIRDQAIQALIAHRDKLAVTLSIQLLQELEKSTDEWKDRWMESITETNATLKGYVGAIGTNASPMPDTPAKWNDWWKSSAHLFTFDMRPKTYVVDAAASQASPPPFKTSIGVDIPKWVRNANWHWDERRLGPMEGISQADKYDVVIASRPGQRGQLRFAIQLGGKEKYAWNGHAATVFRILDDVLYYPSYSNIANGGSIVAVGLQSGKVKWESQLQGIGTVSHSMYGNKILIEVSSETVTIWGNEDAGCYVEVKELKTGKTVGHRIFSRP